MFGFGAYPQHVPIDHTPPPPPPDLDALRAELDRLRQAQALTWEQLADRAGIARQTIFNVRGHTDGNLTTWFQIAWALNVPVGDLLAHLGGHRPRADQAGEL